MFARRAVWLVRTLLVIPWSTLPGRLYPPWRMLPAPHYSEKRECSSRAGLILVGRLPHTNESQLACASDGALYSLTAHVTIRTHTALLCQRGFAADFTTPLEATLVPV